MRVLIVGSGGREHAMAWRWHVDAPHDEIIVAPGNAGTADIATNVDVAVTDAGAVARLAREGEVGLVVIGPDAAVAAGVAEACDAVAVPVFGPTAAAARIESSKEFGKRLMARAGIRTARWVAGSSEERSVLQQFVLSTQGRCVVKADGLALGKGVRVCNDEVDGLQALSACLDERRFGDAGDRIIVEERLEGPELSVFGISDGRSVRVLTPSRDYKRALDGDRGPNTGGMGAFAPAAGEDIAGEVLGSVLQPCIDALREGGTPFVGCLYAGLMLTSEGMRVLEFNARFGDPETQAVLPLIDEPLPSLLVDAAHGGIVTGIAATRSGACAAVVAAAGGYPGVPRTGDPISGLEHLDQGVLCFHAGTRRDDEGVLRTAGGRVLAVTACGVDVDDARTTAYANLRRVHFEAMQFRGDIAAGLVTAAMRA